METYLKLTWNINMGGFSSCKIMENLLVDTKIEQGLISILSNGGQDLELK